MSHAQSCSATVVRLTGFGYQVVGIDLHLDLLIPGSVRCIEADRGHTTAAGSNRRNDLQRCNRRRRIPVGVKELYLHIMHCRITGVQNRRIDSDNIAFDRVRRRDTNIAR